jgi:hypothetical protein
MASNPQAEASRRSIRHPCDRAFRLLTTSAQYFPGRCINRGEGGFAAFVACELEEGENVMVEFTPRGLAHPVLLQAKVVHADKGAYGFQFVAPPQLQGEMVALLFEM